MSGVRFFDKIQSMPKHFSSCLQSAGASFAQDVHSCKVSLEDFDGMRGAHQLAVAAAASRLSQDNVRVLQAHDALATRVHKALVAIVNARNSAFLSGSRLVAADDLLPDYSMVSGPVWPEAL